MCSSASHWKPLSFLLLSLLLGCTTQQDDNAVDDDDTSDDDADDDDMADDDTSSDDDGYPGQPYLALDFEVEASGGPNGGPASVNFTCNYCQDNPEPLCYFKFEITADYQHGTDQGQAFWSYIDETVNWLEGAEIENTCPPEFDVYKGDFIDWFQWSVHPLSFVSCDQILSDPKLGATWLGDDPSGQAQTGQASEYCEFTGPNAQQALGSGPIEGIWMWAGTQGVLEDMGEYAYFQPENPGTNEHSSFTYDAWFIGGFLMADPGNQNEPAEGLSGRYFTVPLWIWSFTVGW